MFVRFFCFFLFLFLLAGKSDVSSSDDDAAKQIQKRWTREFYFMPSENI